MTAENEAAGPSGVEDADAGDEPVLRASVVITTFQRPEMLAEALRSVERQSVRPLEVIVVDDGSEPPVAVESELPVRVLRLERRGASAARNAGLAAAVGDVVFFLDDDDLFAERRIERALEVHRTGADIVCCNQRQFGPGESPDLSDDAAAPIAGARSGEVSAALLLRRFTPTLGATSILRGSCPPLDETYRGAEDVEWWIRLAEQGRVTTWVPERDFVYRQHGGDRSGNGLEVRIRCSEQLLVDHHDFYRQHRQARAFRLVRLSMMSRALGSRRTALGHALRSLTVWPSGPGLRALFEATGLDRSS